MDKYLELNKIINKNLNEQSVIETLIYKAWTENAENIAAQAAAELAHLSAELTQLRAELERVRAAGRKSLTLMSYCARYVDGDENDELISACTELRNALKPTGGESAK